MRSAEFDFVNANEAVVNEKQHKCCAEQDCAERAGLAPVVLLVHRRSNNAADHLITRSPDQSWSDVIAQAENEGEKAPRTNSWQGKREINTEEGIKGTSAK